MLECLNVSMLRCFRFGLQAFFRSLFPFLFRFLENIDYFSVLIIAAVLANSMSKTWFFTMGADG